MTKRDFFKKIFSPIVGFNLLGMVLFGVLVWFGSQKWMRVFTHHGEAIEVPSLTGMNVSEAEEALKELDLLCEVVDSVYDSSKPAGIIMEQKPGTGSMVKGGRSIYLTINKSAADFKPLPNIIHNRDVQQARQILMQNKFIVGGTEYAAGDKDMVIGVKQNGREVRNGQMISPELPLTLVVGNTIQESNENSETYSDYDDEEDWGIGVDWEYGL